MPRYQERVRMSGPSTKPTRALVGEIGSQLVQLAQSEMELARAEFAGNVRAGRRTVVALAVAVVATLLGLGLLLVAVVLALALVMPGWLAALIVAGVVLAAGAVTGYAGWTHRPRAPLALTRKSLKEDWEWLKEQLA